jgi:hypothetical protein
MNSKKRLRVMKEAQQAFVDATGLRSLASTEDVPDTWVICGLVRSPVRLVVRWVFRGNSFKRSV